MFSKYFFLAGVLKNKFVTSIIVPTVLETSFLTFITPSSTSIKFPYRKSLVLDVMRRFETDAIDARASPRKPNVLILNKSVTSFIFEVACFSTHKTMSLGPMPRPLSLTLIKDLPPSTISMCILVAPASKEFSISSLTTDTGPSITSPAAILFIKFESNNLMTIQNLRTLVFYNIIVVEYMR